MSIASFHPTIASRFDTGDASIDHHREPFRYRRRSINRLVLFAQELDHAYSAISKWKCCFSYRRHHDAQEAKQWPRCTRQQWPDGSIWSQPAGMAQGDDFKMKRISRIACPGGELERETRCAWIERSRHLNAARWNGARC